MLQRKALEVAENGQAQANNSGCDSSDNETFDQNVYEKLLNILQIPHVLLWRVQNEPHEILDFTL